MAEGEGGGTEGEGESGQVIPFDQVIMRGEDITGQPTYMYRLLQVHVYTCKLRTRQGTKQMVGR